MSRDAHITMLYTKHLTGFIQCRNQNNYVDKKIAKEPTGV